MNRFCLIKEISILVFLVVSFGPYSFSQKNEWAPSYTNISVNEGLPSSETYFVYQDRKGLIWICTDRGVVRFDGYRYQVFTKEQGLLDNVVFKVMEDCKGRIWFLSYNHRLCYFENDKIHSYKFNHILAKHRGRNYSAYAWFSFDQKDNIYFSVKTKPIIRISKTGKTTVFKHEHPVNFTKINGRWMFSSINNISKNNYLIHLNFDKKKQKVNARADKTDFCVGRQEIQQFGKTIYVTNRSSVYSSEGDSCTIDYIIGSHKIGDDLWVGTLKGAYLFEKVQKNGLSVKPKIFLKQYSVTSVCKDSEGGYWFSTLERGIIYTPNLKVLNCDFSENPRENSIQDIYLNKRLFIVSNIYGYFEFPSRKIVSKLEQINYSQIPYIGDFPFLTGTGTSKNRVPGIRNIRKDVGSWCRESDTSILISGSYISRYNINGDSCTIHHPVFEPGKFKFVKHRFRTIAVSPEGDLYIADLNGLYKFERGVFKPVHFAHFPENTRVSDLDYSKHWGLIISTAGRGIYIVRNGQVIRIITDKEGLISNQINRLLSDNENNLFVCTNKGISKVSLNGRNKLSIQNLTYFQGLKGSEVNSCFEYGNTLYFATKEGLSKVDNSYDWLSEQHSRQIKVLDIFANGRKVKTKNEGITLDYRFKVIRIRLASTNFKTRGKTPYKYRLSGNSSWSVGYNGEILLLNPAYEKFNIEIKYKNENGIWSEPYFLTSIEITPPFYRQIWFYVLVTFSLLITIIFILLRRIRSIHRKAEVQRNMELLEQKALLAQMNPHFIFNALNSIQSFLLYDENELAERYLLKLSKLIRLTLINSRETEITIQKEIESLEMYLELEQMRFKNRFEFHLEISLLKEDLTKFVPPMLIQPFAENAILHGFKGLEQGGKVHVHFKRIDHNKLIVEIADNGVGYKKLESDKENSNHKSYGTQITSERLSLFKERYHSEFDFSIEHLEDKNGNSAGTRVIVSIPVFRKD